MKLKVKTGVVVFSVIVLIVSSAKLLCLCSAQQAFVFEIDEPKDNAVYYPGDSLLVKIFVYKPLWYEEGEIIVRNPNNKVIYNGHFRVTSLENTLSLFTFPKSETNEFVFGEYTITIAYGGQVKSVKIHFSPRFVFELWSSDTSATLNKSIKVNLFLKNVCSETFYNVTLLLKTESGTLIYAGRGDIWSPVVSWDLEKLKPNNETILEADVRIKDPSRDRITFIAEVYGIKENTNGKILLQRDILTLNIKNLINKSAPTKLTSENPTCGPGTILGLILAPLIVKRITLNTSSKIYSIYKEREGITTS